MRWLLTIFRIIVILIAAIPFSILAIVIGSFEQTKNVYFWSGTTWSRFVLFLCNVDVKAIGLDNINRDGNYILVSNHASMFDIPAVMSTFPHVRIMFKKELGYIPIWGWALWIGHHIIVDRKKGTEAIKSLDRAAQAAKDGGQVLLFAEGTRTRDGKLQSFKRGAFTLAAKSGVPIVPLTINGSYSILPKGSFDIRPAHITVVIGKPIATEHITTREQEMKLMNDVRDVITQSYVEST